MNMLNTVLCKQKAEKDAPLRYCILSLLPLFDLPYFFSLASGAAPKPPGLANVANSVDRQSLMCESPVCNAFVENLASSVVGQLPDGPNTQAAADFIRGVVSRMRCGCTGIEAPCYKDTVTNGFILDSAGVKSFAEGKACEANGVMSACARTWHNCEAVPKPSCAKPCDKASIATVKFNLKNLNYTCLVEKATDVLKTVRADALAFVSGLLDEDITCECSAGTAGTQCTCIVTCTALATLRNMNLAGNLNILKKLADVAVVPTPNLDKAASACKITPDGLSFGNTFELVSVETSFPDEGASSTLFVGASVAFSLFLSLVL
jgi:hypothetical protein